MSETLTPRETATPQEQSWPQCAVCDSDLHFSWTDTHGVGACCNCGAPHVIYHYETGSDDKKHRVEKPWSCALTDSGIALARRYWTEKRAHVFPGACDMGIFGGGNRTYSGATREEMLQWAKWLETAESAATR